MEPKAFYDLVAGLLGTEHAFVEPASGSLKKRWGPRHPGNGRYPGYGIVRMFSPTNIHVALHTPNVSGQFASTDDALAAITLALA